MVKINKTLNNWLRARDEHVISKLYKSTKHVKYKSLFFYFYWFSKSRLLKWPVGGFWRAFTQGCASIGDRPIASQYSSTHYRSFGGGGTLGVLYISYRRVKNIRITAHLRLCATFLYYCAVFMIFNCGNIVYVVKVNTGYQTFDRKLGFYTSFADFLTKLVSWRDFCQFHTFECSSVLGCRN